MKINFSQCLQDLDGSALDWTTMACGVCGPARESKPATLRTLCAGAGLRCADLGNRVGRALHAARLLLLDQADLSEEFIEFTTTVGAGNPMDTAAHGAYYGKARVMVTGVGYKVLALYEES